LAQEGTATAVAALSVVMAMEHRGLLPTLQSPRTDMNATFRRSGSLRSGATNKGEGKPFQVPGQSQIPHLNPFDNAFELMKDLQVQVHELSASLTEEKRIRTREVSELNVGLNQERTERTSLWQHLNQNIENVSQRLNSAQDRIRFDMADLRAALQMECDERAESCANITARLEQKTERLEDLLNKLDEEKNSNHDLVTRSVQNTHQSWNEAVANTNNKFDNEVDKLTNHIRLVAYDLEEWSRVSKQMQAGMARGFDVVMGSMRAFDFTQESENPPNWSRQNPISAARAQAPALAPSLPSS